MITNVLLNISSYKSEMTISQVVRFFDGFGMGFTKTMIQNYVRVGVIPPPVRKRYYVKNHIILLAMIYELKESCSLPEISKLFKLYIKSDNSDELTDLYNKFLILYAKYIKAASDDSLMNLAVQTAVNRKIVKNMMDNEDL